MKSLPEKEMFNALEGRLRNFTEDPDDEVWNKIAQTIPGKEPVKVWAWLDHAATVAGIATLLFLLWNFTGDQSVETNQAVVITEAKPNVEIGDVHSSEKQNEKVFTDRIHDSGRSSDGGSTYRHQLSKKVEQLNQFVVAAKSSSVGARTDQQTVTLFTPHTHSDLQQVVDRSSSDSIAKSQAFVDSVVSVGKKVTASTAQKKKVKKRNATLYLSLTPSLGYLKIIPLENDDVVVNGLESESIFSSNRMGFSVDAGLQHRFTKRWEAYVGINYYQQNQQVTYYYQAESVSVVPDGDGYAITPNQEEKRIDYSMRNTGVAAGVFYLIKDGRLQHKAGVGVQYQRGVLAALSEGEYKNSESQYFNYQLTYRVEYQINNRMSFFFQPSFTHAIQVQEHLDAPFTIKPYRAGIGFGMTCRL